jgi:cbb3-type cytochrome oxidase subunit 3
MGLNRQKNFLYLLPIFALFFSFCFSITVFAQDQAPYQNYGLEETTNGNVGKALIKDTPTQVAGTIIGAVLSLLGVIFFLLIFYGGIRWMLAQGNEQEVEKAKQILVAACIGLVIVLAAYAITAFIGNQITTPAPEIDPSALEGGSA